MAAGDYSKTTYVNGSAPAISASNLNNIEDKVDELDTIVGTLVGSVTMYAGSSAPTGWLLCNGQAVSRTTYSALFSAIGTTWGTGDGSTTFNVPDMRESAPVGVGTFSAVTGTTHGAQVAADAYTLGQFKDDQGQGHRHAFSSTGAGANPVVSIATSAAVGANGGKLMITDGTSYQTWKILDPSSDGSNGTPRTGAVTRGKRIGINFIIKY